MMRVFVRQQVVVIEGRFDIQIHRVESVHLFFFLTVIFVISTHPLATVCVLECKKGPC